MVVRVVVADDNYLLREGVVGLIDAEPELEVVGVAGSLDELLEVVDTAEPDVVITDIRMPPTGTDEGVRAAAPLRESHPTVGRRRAQPVRLAGVRPRPCSRPAPTAGPTCSRTASPTPTTWSTRCARWPPAAR